MQRSDFTMSDFYASWQQVENILGKLLKKNCGVELATLLIENMNNRKEKLLDNPAMLCCILLDPRFCQEIKAERTKLGIDTLLNLWRKLKDFNEFQTEDIAEAGESSDEEISIASTTMLKEFLKKSQVSEQITAANVFQIADEIEAFIACVHEIPDGSIYDFWKQNKPKFPNLFKLAEVIYSISPTQAIVERAFSTLSHIFSSKRNNIKEKLLEDILLISLNKELLDIVNDDDISALMNNVNAI